MRVDVKASVRVDLGGGSTDIEPFTKYGGAVLNATINKYVYGSIIKLPNKTILEYHADIPTSSGLGTSGVMNVVWLALTTRFKDKLKLAELAYDIERATGVVGGKQDQYAAVLGGINFLRFNPDIKIERLHLRKSFIRKLESHLFLHYTGPRSSSDINGRIIEHVIKKNKKTIDTLKNIVKNTYEMRDSLLREDLSEFFNNINVEWELRKSLHHGITTKVIDKRINFAMENGAMAAKVCGAGGGGCILFGAKDKAKLMSKFNNVIDFKFDIRIPKIWT